MDSLFPLQAQFLLQPQNRLAELLDLTLRYLVPLQLLPLEFQTDIFYFSPELFQLRFHFLQPLLLDVSESVLYFS